MIGPPGAGKTTALLNAGLEFPLSDELGPGAIEGVGGTRLCDWWFTRDAVLIDTAGRYTTQDSNREVDRAGWQAFLDLLRRTRPRQPLNGVIVAIALNDVAGNDAALAEDHARAIRERVDELEARLGVRMPVYALFTKADLLIGFSEFFDDLEREGRAQIWGATFPVEGEADLAGALDPLLQRLSRRMFPRLDREAAAERQALIAGFPGQFASLLAPVQAFAARAFGPDAAGRKPWLRGVYFTSATQEGTPIDRLIGGLSRAFGLDQRRAARMRPEAGRSYFLSGVLRDVVFREAMLLAHRPGTERRRRVIRMAGFAACGIAAVLGAFVLLSARASSLAGDRRRRRTARDPACRGTAARSGRGCRFRAARAISGRDTPDAADRIEHAGGPHRILAGQQAPGRRGCALPARAELRAVPPADLAGGGADARRPGAAGLAVRGDPDLPHAGRQWADRSGAGPGMVRS